MRIRQQAVPLGALQRWIRDLDALDGNPLVLRVIDAVMRTVDDTAAPEHDMCPDVNESNGVRRHGSWSCLPPSGISLYEEIKRGTLVDPSRSEELRSRFKVVQETAGPNRLPPNLHPAILYSSTPNTVPLPPESTVVTSHSVPGLSNATFLSSILTHAECRQIISCAEAVGMLPDQPASGSAVTLASVLAHNFYWLADETFISALFQRVKAHLPEIVQGGQLRGLNRRFRLYRYTKEAVYRPHIDGAWPPSGIDAAGGYVYDASPPGKPQSSRYTFLIYLNDDFSCGETTFFTPSAKEGILDVRPVRPIAGCALVFPHGDTIGSLVHMGSEVGATEEVKYIIRTDVVYDIV
ncbi:hypothetical protein K439DRAFT_1632903 [Ramaria rubella]|nr:hypothetical protein K439DRAFT_1632903 [Ramaria rubella]